MKTIEEEIEGKVIEQEQREYLGISQIGGACKRQQWFDFRLASPPETISARQQRLFNRGHFEELIILNDLVQISGAKLEDIEIGECVHEVFKNVFGHDLPRLSQKKVEFAHGHGSGHGDGRFTMNKDGEKQLVVVAGESLLNEFKTSNVKGFNDLKRDHNLKRSKPQHFTQIQCYMKEYKLKKCLYIMVNKETDERIYIHLDIDKKFAEEQLSVAERTIFAPTPPDRIGDRNFYMCRPYMCKVEGVEKEFCRHRKICHEDKRWNKTCRTCKAVEMHDEGRWKCTKKGKFLSFKKQLKGCKNYASI